MESKEVHVPRLQNPLQVTSAAGVESDPTWSPDGGRIAYVSDQSGNLDIWVTQLAGGPAANFTADHEGSDDDPSWSPDGSQIAFVSDREGSGIYVMPAIGGLPQRISPRGSAESLLSPQWSPDGTELAHIRREDQGTFIEVVSLRTRESRRLRIPGDAGTRCDLSWSLDGRFFAYVRAGTRDDGASRLWVLRAADTQAFAVTDGMTSDWSPRWSIDGGTLFFLSNRGGSMDAATCGSSPSGGTSSASTRHTMSRSFFPKFSSSALTPPPSAMDARKVRLRARIHRPAETTNAAATPIAPLRNPRVFRKSAATAIAPLHKGGAFRTSAEAPLSLPSFTEQWKRNAWTSSHPLFGELPIAPGYAATFLPTKLPRTNGRRLMNGNTIAIIATSPLGPGSRIAMVATHIQSPEPGRDRSPRSLLPRP